MNCFVFSSALPILKIVGLDEIDYGADARDAVRLVTSISDVLMIFSANSCLCTRRAGRNAHFRLRIFCAAAFVTAGHEFTTPN